MKGKLEKKVKLIFSATFPNQKRLRSPDKRIRIFSRGNTIILPVRICNILETFIFYSWITINMTILVEINLKYSLRAVCHSLARFFEFAKKLKVCLHNCSLVALWSVGKLTLSMSRFLLLFVCFYNYLIV